MVDKIAAAAGVLHRVRVEVAVRSIEGAAEEEKQAPEDQQGRGQARDPSFL
jgi:hypothetical protein